MSLNVRLKGSTRPSRQVFKAIFALGLSAVLGFPSAVLARAKADLTVGGFSLQAKANQKEGGISGLGAYKLGFAYAIFPKFEFAIAYSILMSGTIGGDIGYGPDLSFNYYPLTLAGPMTLQTENVEVRVADVYRPFISGGFHQRQFMSVESAYAGFSVGGGLEYSWSSSFSLKTEARYIVLSGPSGATGTEMDVLAGISFPF